MIDRIELGKKIKERGRSASASARPPRLTLPPPPRGGGGGERRSGVDHHIRRRGHHIPSAHRLPLAPEPPEDASRARRSPREPATTAAGGGGRRGEAKPAPAAEGGDPAPAVGGGRRGVEAVAMQARCGRGCGAHRGEEKETAEHRERGSWEIKLWIWWLGHAHCGLRFLYLCLHPIKPYIHGCLHCGVGVFVPIFWTKGTAP